MSNKEIFVGGLSDSTTEESLKEYFKDFGIITCCKVRTGKNTAGAQERYAFITFKEEDSVNKVLSKANHMLDGSEVNPEPRAHDGDAMTVFVYGITDSMTEQQIRAHFDQYGPIEDVNFITDKGKRRASYCFVKFLSKEIANSARDNSKQFLEGKEIQVKERDPPKVQQKGNGRRRSSRFEGPKGGRGRQNISQQGFQGPYFAPQGFPDSYSGPQAFPFPYSAPQAFRFPYSGPQGYPGYSQQYGNGYGYGQQQGNAIGGHGRQNGAPRVVLHGDNYRNSYAQAPQASGQAYAQGYGQPYAWGASYAGASAGWGQQHHHRQQQRHPQQQQHHQQQQQQHQQQHGYHPYQR